MSLSELQSFHHCVHWKWYSWCSSNAALAHSYWNISFRQCERHFPWTPFLQEELGQWIHITIWKDGHREGARGGRECYALHLRYHGNQLNCPLQDSNWLKRLPFGPQETHSQVLSITCSIEPLHCSIHGRENRDLGCTDKNLRITTFLSCGH